MDVYILLIVVFAIAFLTPCLRWLYLNYLASLIQCIIATYSKVKRKISTRKSKFQQELERMAEQFGVSSSDLQVV